MIMNNLMLLPKSIQGFCFCMGSFAWNEWICASNIFVILNFTDAFKEGINSNANMKMQKKSDNKMKIFPSFWITGILKELVIIVSNQSILINTFFHFGIFWIKKTTLVPRGARFWKIESTLWSCLFRQWIIKFLIQKPFLEFFENKKNEFL